MSESVTAALRDPARFRQLVQQYGSYEAIAEALGTYRERVRYWGHKHGIPGAPAGRQPKQDVSTAPAPAPAVSVVPASPAPQKPPPRLEQADLLKALAQPRTLVELANEWDCSPRAAEEKLRALRAAGYQIIQVGDRYQLDRVPVPAEARFKPANAGQNVIRFALVSDTHLCSTKQQLTALHEFYQLAAAEGIADVYHCGDLIAGVGVYQGQHHELFRHEMDAQVEYAAEHYPRIEGITTHVIGGNHDLVFVKQVGADPLVQLAARRPDIHYLGQYSAWIDLGNGISMYLVHPDGGKAYAISYKLQQLVGSLDVKKQPHILVAGHWHQMGHFCIRGVHALHPGCWQAQTDFERRRGLQPVVGGVLVTVRVREPGQIWRFTPEEITYFNTKDHDY